MSLDIVVWLSCAVSLPTALPESEEWKHWRASPQQLSEMPKELASMLEGHESWDLERPQYILRAAYESKEPVDWEELARLAPGIEINVIKTEMPGVTDEQAAAKEKRRRIYQGMIRDAKMGVSLVLEGVNDPGVEMQERVAVHLAKACGGALLETPAGYYELDRQGNPKVEAVR